MINAVRFVTLAATVFLATIASAQEPQLGALHATLITLRVRGEEPAEDLGPELAAAKHQLREWIEMRLDLLDDFQHAKPFFDQINEALKAVDVTGDDQNLLGSLGDVGFSEESGLLIVTTAIGIPCQYDQSAYGYKRTDGHWQRIWESEQNDYSPKRYAPQHIAAVHVWRSFKDGHENGPPFVMALGNGWGCASAWHPVYYRVWRVDSSGSKLLIDDSEEAWLRTESYVVGSIAQDRTDQNAPVDVLVEFTERSVDTGVHNREAVRHFLIDGDRVRRVDPVALSPRDFVDEWLTRAWSESALWSASPAFAQWHRRLHAEWVGGDFGYPTMHCQSPDLWQVTFERSNPQKNFAAEPPVYFLVRWSPPFHFAMMAISDKAWPLCSQEDRKADEWRTLFSTQDWRQ